jgi:hypothetical protein
MTTEYTQADSLPKDAGGAKFAALIDDNTSQLDFALARGIGAETLGTASQIAAHTAVATHTAGSALGTRTGVALMGAYTESPSAIGTDNAQQVRSDKEGALYVRPASGIMVFNATSADIHVSGSLLLHDIHVTLVDVNAGDSITIEDGSSVRYSFIATAASQHFNENFSAGQFFSTSLRHRSSLGPTAAAASVSLAYSQY